MIAQGNLPRFFFIILSHVFHTASSGQEALTLTEKEKYDVILMDQRMPGMDGTETLHLIRAQENGCNTEIPVICLTADAVSGAKEKYMSQGFTDYLSKPIIYEELEKTLIKYLPAALRPVKPEDEG